MIELKRGNWNNLEGRCVVYSGFQNCFEEKDLKESDGIFSGSSGHYSESPAGIAAIYMDCNVDRLLEVVANESIVPFAPLDSKKEEIKRKHAKDVLNFRKGVNELYPLKSVILVPFEERDLFELESDVLFAGNFNKGIHSLRAISLASTFYSLSYTDQILKVNVPHYTRLSPDNVAGHIKNRYLNPMIEALRNCDGGRILNLERELRSFCQGALFWNHIENICALLSANPFSDHIVRRVDLEAHIIDAIATSKFEKAREIKIVLEKLRR